MEYRLNNKWVLWFHHTNDDNWTEESYIKIGMMETIADFWNIVNKIPDFINGMFFLMKKDIFPRWEDINNLDGGYWSFRIIKKDANKVWINMMMLLIGETIIDKHDNIEEINGISISPKINNCIIKIWNKDSTKNNIEMITKSYNISKYSDVMYKIHKEHDNFHL